MYVCICKVHTCEESAEVSGQFDEQLALCNRACDARKHASERSRGKSDIQVTSIKGRETAESSSLEDI